MKEYLEAVKDENIPKEDKLVYLVALEYNMSLCKDKMEQFEYNRTFDLTLVSDNACAIVRMGKLSFSDVGQAVSFNDYFLKKQKMIFFSTEENSKMINLMGKDIIIVDYEKLLVKWSK